MACQHLFKANCSLVQIFATQCTPCKIQHSPKGIQQISPKQAAQRTDRHNGNPKQCQCRSHHNGEAPSLTAGDAATIAKSKHLGFIFAANELLNLRRALAQLLQIRFQPEGACTCRAIRG